MSLGLIPKFTNVFPEEEIPQLSDLLKDTPSRLSIGILSYINGSLYLEDNMKTQYYFINQLVGRCSFDIIKSIFTNLLIFANDQHVKNINAFPLFSVLKFQEWEIANYRQIDFKDSTAEQELSIFKAMLIFNEKLDEVHGNIKLNRASPFELFWPVGLPQIEFSSRKFFLNKIPGSMDLLKYIESKYPKNFSEYLSSLNIENTTEIFRNLIEFFINGYKKESNVYKTNFSTELLSKNQILESFVLDITKIDKEIYHKRGFDKYFKGLRKWPLVQHNSDTFDVLNWNFISDKFSTIAIVFDFYYKTSINESVSFDNFKSDIGTQFAEKVVFANTIRSAFQGNYTHITPEENNEINVDYYLRYENHILLFEYKDYTIPDRVKNGSFEDIKKYFYSRFVKNERGQEKGVLQLKKQIETLFSGPEQIEDFESLGISKHRLFLYPIIIVNDDSFTVPGFENYLNMEFKNSVRGNTFDFFLIENLTVIQLDFLIEYAFLFKGRDKTLHSLIHRHHLELTAREAIFNHFKNPNTHLSRFESFKHTTVPKLSRHDFTETPIFKRIVDQLGFPKK